MTNLLGSLQHVRWQTAFRTFGNDHATLIGLLVDWWISGDPAQRWALEGGPSFGFRPRTEQGNGQCDAAFGEGTQNAGILEVEGTRHAWTIEKIGRFFAAEYPEFATLRFGIFLAYAYGAVGTGPGRAIPPFPLDEFVAHAKSVTAARPGRQLAVLALDKLREPQPGGSPRFRSEFYWGRPLRVTGALVVDGQEIGRRILYQAQQ